MPSLTLAQAEVANALYGLKISNEDLPQIDPKEVFADRSNAHNGARRTFSRLVALGFIEEMPPGHLPRYKVTARLFEELRVWRNNPKNYKAFQNFELSCSTWR